MLARRGRVSLLVFLLSAAGLSGRVGAQAGGVFLCSAGSNNGNTCEAQADCPGGACVILQGVCNDQNGFPCTCPDATCSGTTCTGGPFAGQSCDTAYNCDAGVACQGSQKVCAGGATSGYPCLYDQQCDSLQCLSTGSLCEEGTDYAGYSCWQDSDCCLPPTTCAVGACFSPAAVPTPTTPSAVTRTATASRTGATETPTPSPSAKASVTPTAGASPTGATVTPRPTPPPRPTQAPPHGLLIQAVGEGAGCAITAGGDGWLFAGLTGAIVLLVARRRSELP
jgi:hypothetical protein